MRKVFFIVFILGVTFGAFAQSVVPGCRNLLEKEVLLSGSLYNYTCNATGLAIDSISGLKYLEFFYNHRQGDFNRASESDLSDNFGFKTSGFKKMDKIVLAGSFDYDRTYDKNIDWYTRFDPDEPNPFYFADSIGGDWLKDRFKTVFSISSVRPWHGLFTGIRTEYNVGLGGRDNDPRPQSLWMNLKLYPSLSWYYQHIWVGVTGIFGTRREDIDIMNRYGIGGNTLFKINGLMLYGQPIVKSSLTYRYDEIQSGFALQTGYRKCGLKWFAEIEFLDSYESSVQSPYAADMDEETYEFTSTAIHDADFFESLIKGNTGLKMILNEHTLFTDFTVTNSVGKSYIVDNEQVEFKYDILSLSWRGDIYFGSSEKVRSGAGIKIDYLHSDSYNYFYAHQLISMAGAIIHYNHTFGSPDRWSVGIKFSTGGYIDLGSKLEIAPDTPFIPESTAITDPVVIHDYNVLSTGYLLEAADAVLYFPSKKGQHFYLKGSGECLIPGQPWNYLWEAKGSLGLFF